jgi:hypothetical protein
VLQDPENVEDFSQEIAVPFNSDKAVMEAEAWKLCQQQFGTDGVTQIIRVEQRTRAPNRGGKVKWICKVRAEREKPKNGNGNES